MDRTSFSATPRVGTAICAVAADRDISPQAGRSSRLMSTTLAKGVSEAAGRFQDKMNSMSTFVRPARSKRWPRTKAG